jgi:hypothetical protein
MANSQHLVGVAKKAIAGCESVAMTDIARDASPSVDRATPAVMRGFFE